MIYQEIHHLKSLRFSNNKIAKRLNISRNRVIDYSKMTPGEFAIFIGSLQIAQRSWILIETIY